MSMIAVRIPTPSVQGRLCAEKGRRGSETWLVPGASCGEGVWLTGLAGA